MAVSAFECEVSQDGDDRSPWTVSEQKPFMIVPSETTETTSNPVVSGKERPGIFPLPLTPLEQFLFQCDTAASPMIIRIVLRLTGEADLECLKETLLSAIGRHPLATCRITGNGNQSCWIHGPPAKINVCHLAGSIFEPDGGPTRKKINLRIENGLHAEIHIMDDGIKVVIDAHHAVTDGNGLRQIVTEWFHLYHCQITGVASRLPVLDSDRLQQRHHFPAPAAAAPIGLREAIRNLLVTIRGRTARWTLRRRTTSESSSSQIGYCVERILSQEQYDHIQLRLEQWKVTLNDLMLAICMSTFAKMAPAGHMKHLITILNPTDLRLPSDRRLPAANRFGFAFIRRPRATCVNPAALLKGIHDEMHYVRSNYIGAEFIKGLASASRIPGGVDLIRKLGLFIPSLQWTCLGDITRGGKRLMTWKDGAIFLGELRLETVTGFAPFADNVPLSIATCETGRRITLTVQANSRFMNESETKAFALAIEDMICSFELPPTDSEASDHRKDENAD